MKKLLLWLVIIILIVLVNVSYAQEAGSGHALKFNGSTNYADCGDVVLGTTDFTIEGWFNFAGLGNNKGLMGTWKSGWPPYFYLSYGLLSSSDLTLAFHMTGVSNTYATYNTTGVLGWHHIAGTFKRNGNMILYLDGIPRDSASISFASGQSVDYAPSSFQLGSLGSGASGLLFSGQIDEVRIWSKALSASEIRDKMCMKLKGTEAGLKAYWRMDEGTGNTIFDSSTSGYNGTTY
ncbi:MAG: hypothetical protein K0S32_1366 [Bacteroidetes bacterium]|jgi:hypothetical protein|nr:hypothetical protein [Bacteroidota bacterium]